MADRQPVHARLWEYAAEMERHYQRTPGDDVAMIAVAEVACAARFINILLALSIIVLPWLLGSATLASGINDLIIGMLIIGLSIPPGKIKNTYSNWNPLIN